MPVEKDNAKMKQTENTHYVKVVEYRACITLLNAYLGGFHGCCNDAERRDWRARAREQLSKVASIRCHRTKPVDIRRFESVCERLQQCINSLSPEGQLCAYAV